MFLAIGLQTLMAAERGIAIEWDPRESAEGAGTIWLGYLMARTAYREKHKLPLPVSGEIIPTFAEEVSARSDAAAIYQELKAKDKKLHDTYWEQLVQVGAKGFMPAYVWTYLRRPSWSEREAPRDLDVFERWRASALKDHKAQTHGRLAVTPK
ncbi:MAG: hypothetical protein DLM73_08165 [Chthoniobacterales bacterium]|nr:MAG: hypothetical protein DLM73_08165 [Chthoniobacterales bacterium]